MKGASNKISKACEPCRRRKMKCSGEVPCCQRCLNPAECVYRPKPRIRGLLRQATVPPVERNPVESIGPAGINAAPNTPHSDVYHSVAATDHTPQSAYSSQLFYGPSSNFAFLQQIHRNILSGPRGSRSGSDVQEGGPGLDMFIQRSIFFGTPSSDPIPFSSPERDYDLLVSKEDAAKFAQNFKGTYLPIMALLSPAATDALFLCVYGDTPESSPTPRRAMCFAMLAIGALDSPRTDLAELLYGQAKKDAIAYEEYVSLPMIQFSILLADYQLNMGRPNAAYLHLGTACRKAFALGLHQGNIGVLPERDAQQRCNTIWCLYFFEIWLSLVLGRKNMMRRSDLASYPFPEKQPVLAALCRLGIIAEEAIEVLYTQRAASLRALYTTAEGLYVQLRDWGNMHSVGTEAFADRPTLTLTPVASLLVHSVYFHTILLAFRPFLIAESALAANGMSQLSGGLWLRQACRRATDTAQDAICFLDQMFQKSDKCKTIRFAGFFFETCCAVLFYDSLRHPAKHLYNMEYIQVALRCLGSMVAGEPMNTAIQSILRIQQVVEQSIARRATNESAQSGSSNPMPTRPLDRAQSNIQFSSLDRNTVGFSNDLILFTERNDTIEPVYQPGELSFEQGADPLADPFCFSNLDVLTTDLFSFFPTFAAGTNSQ